MNNYEEKTHGIEAAMIDIKKTYSGLCLRKNEMLIL
jgi:hypothetical protein